MLLQVCVYIPKWVFQELQIEKEDFIRDTFSPGKDQRIILLKNLQSFGKDSRLCEVGAIEMIQIYLPYQFKKAIRTIHTHTIVKSK